jgi:hypothetical protein
VNIQKAVAESYVSLAEALDREPSLVETLAQAGVTEAEYLSQFTSLEGALLVSLEEMLWMLQGSNMPRRLDEGNFGPDAARSICDDIIVRVTEAWQPVTVGVRYHRAAVELAIGRAIQHRAAAYFAAYPGFRQIDDSFLATSSHYVGHGLAAIVTGWVGGDLSNNPEAIADHMTELLPAWLTDPPAIPDIDKIR